MRDEVTLVASPCFVVEKFALNETRCFEAAHSPQIFVALEGSGAVEGASPNFGRGQVLVVPADGKQVRIRPNQGLKMLRMTLPAEPM